MKKYDSDFYKKLPLQVRQSIFKGATTLASGFLAFDSTNVAGTGGGPAALLGRLGALELAEDWILKITTDMALKVQLTTQEVPDGNNSEPEEDSEIETTPEDKFISTENKHTGENSSAIQQIQIVNVNKDIIDLGEKLDSIIESLK